MDKKEELIKQLELIKQFEDDQKRLSAANAAGAIKCASIGKYKLVRMFGADDIYNNAMVEEDRHYLIDKEGIPHLICQTHTGNANSNPTPIKEIDKNEKLLKDIVYAVVISESKSPFKLIDEKNIQSILSQLENCIEKNDFSTFNIDEFKSSISQRVLKSFEDKHKNGNHKFFQETNMYSTKEQRERNYKRCKEERAL